MPKKKYNFQISANVFYVTNHPGGKAHGATGNFTVEGKSFPKYAYGICTYLL